MSYWSDYFDNQVITNTDDDADAWAWDAEDMLSFK